MEKELWIFKFWYEKKYYSEFQEKKEKKYSGIFILSKFKIFNWTISRLFLYTSTVKPELMTTSE
jgi:hypothetical protein